MDVCSDDSGAPPPPPPPPMPPMPPAAVANVREEVYERRPRQPLALEVRLMHHLPATQLEFVCDLLSQKWPRNEGARIASLRESCDVFPTHLVLLDVTRDRPVCFASLSRCVEDTEALLVENVIVDEALRGQGFGVVLMEAVHAHARSCGFRRIFLSTKDKQAFYKRMGYVVSGCAVTPLSAASERLGLEAVSKLQAAFGGTGAAAVAGGAFTWMVAELIR